MTDPIFIDSILQKGNEAKNKISAFSNITTEQINWKPAESSWSIAQCLEHLMKSHAAYIPVFDKISSGNFKMSFWEKFSPFTSLWGKFFKNQLQENPKRKYKAAKKITPTASDMKLEMLNQYRQSLENFLRSISNCDRIDIDKTVIMSPFISAVTYNLRDLFQFLVQHEHRHINQAMRVKAHEKFPK